jgi:hypothetical protein
MSSPAVRWTRHVEIGSKPATTRSEHSSRDAPKRCSSRQATLSRRVPLAVGLRVTLRRWPRGLLDAAIVTAIVRCSCEAAARMRTYRRDFATSTELLDSGRARRPRPRPSRTCQGERTACPRHSTGARGAQFVLTAPITAENAAAFSASVKRHGRNMRQRISSRETSRAPKRCVSPSARVVLPAPGRPRRTTPSGRPITRTRPPATSSKRLDHRSFDAVAPLVDDRLSDVSAWRQSPVRSGPRLATTAKELASSTNPGPGSAL